MQAPPVLPAAAAILLLLLLHQSLATGTTAPPRGRVPPRNDLRRTMYTHWVGLPPDARLEVPSCAGPDAVWFEGNAPRRRRRLPPTAGAGRLFNGCAAFYRRGFLLGDLLLVLRPDRCVGRNLSVTCLAAALAASSPASVHVLQLAGDSRCPPGTGRDRLGLCRRCHRSGSCPQPDWEAAAGCPAVCADDQAEAEEAEAEASPRPLSWLRRPRRAAVLAAATADGNNSRSTIGKVKVAQLACPNRLSVVATVVCLLEMHYPTRGEVISLLVVAFVTIAFLCVPIYIGYVLGQIYSARFLPFLQFHLYERSALLCSSLRTQAVFAPSLWDFQAFREAEKRRRLEQDKAAAGHQVGDFRRRELQNLLLWHGLED